MAFISRWWYKTPEEKPIAAANVLERNITQQKTLETKARQAEHKAKKARVEATKRAKEKGGMEMAKTLLKQAKMWDRQAI